MIESDTSSVEIVGQIASTTEEMPLITIGMLFSFDGRTLSVHSQNDLSRDAYYADVGNLLMSKKTRVDLIVSGNTVPSFDCIYFHVAGAIAIDGARVSAPVRSYWSIDINYDLSYVSMVRFKGNCVDSFFPRQSNVINDDFSLNIPSSKDSTIQGGIASVENKSVRFSLTSGWTGNPNIKLEFHSYITALIGGLNVSSIELLYESVLNVVSFCLCRSNTKCEVSLYAKETKGHKYIGYFFMNSSVEELPDTRDPISRRRVLAKHLGNDFGNLVQAFIDGTIKTAAFSQSCSDVYRLSDSKIIELTSYFESVFNSLYPKGVEHSSKALAKRSNLVNALEQLKLELKSDESREVDRCIRIVTQDNLQSRIVHAFHQLDQALLDACTAELEIDVNNGQIGSKIQSKRNSIAHGSEPKYSLAEVASEYHFLFRLVRSMELKKSGFSGETIAELVSHM